MDLVTRPLPSTTIAVQGRRLSPIAHDSSDAVHELHEAEARRAERLSALMTRSLDPEVERPGESIEPPALEGLEPEPEPEPDPEQGDEDAQPEPERDLSTMFARRRGY